MAKDNFDDLSEQQKKAAELYVENLIESQLDPEEVPRLKTQEIADEIGVNRTTYYRWNQDDRYLDYVATLSIRHLNKHMPKFAASLIANLVKRNPSTKMLDLYAKVSGVLGDQGSASKDSVNVTFNLSDAQERVRQLKQVEEVPYIPSERRLVNVEEHKHE
ncbi:phBC6A51 family helix-turn-helix protein [Staphylococcus felis]|uniref:Homeodomain phBC6A51-type domain-containing protein n=1 Tax=Staphylococcus felis TaxID=46127 RepID=A0ABS0QLM0_9STAP|nr:phBC6A51 family helix-turn-helix protein [Staphylococcus felis]MBH9580118.1 hypothetical protein [Staphylococcus felis]QQB02621.1 hypothetical protein I6H71_07645 [Staphylococcus felis]